MAATGLYVVVVWAASLLKTVPRMHLVLAFTRLWGREDWLSFCRASSRCPLASSRFPVSWSIWLMVTSIDTCSVFLYSSSGLVTESSLLTLSVDCWYSLRACCIISRPDLTSPDSHSAFARSARLKAIYRVKRSQSCATTKCTTMDIIFILCSATYRLLTTNVFKPETVNTWQK